MHAVHYVAIVYGSCEVLVGLLVYKTNTINSNITYYSRGRGGGEGDTVFQCSCTLSIVLVFMKCLV